MCDSSRALNAASPFGNRAARSSEDPLRRRLNRLETDQRQPLPRRRAEAVAVVGDTAVLVDCLERSCSFVDESDAVDGEDGRDDERHGDAQHDGGDPGHYDRGCE